MGMPSVFTTMIPCTPFWLWSRFSVSSTSAISNRSGSSVSRALSTVPVPFRACAEHPVKTDSFSTQSGTSVRREGMRTLGSSPRACGEFAQRRLKWKAKEFRYRKFPAVAVPKRCRLAVSEEAFRVLLRPRCAQIEAEWGAEAKCTKDEENLGFTLQSVSEVSRATSLGIFLAGPDLVFRISLGVCRF